MNLEELIKNLGLQRAKIRGDEIHASCPFLERHFDGSDKHPSFSINIEKGVYNCFSCESRGTIEDLVARIKGISIVSATDWLCTNGYSKLERELREKPENERPEFLPEGLLLYYDKIEDDFVELYRGEVDGIDCLIYPVRNKEGKLVGALARSVQERFHKILWNMQKKLYLYGEDLVEIEKPIVIVEGPGDVVALRKSKAKNVVALMGINCSDAQIEKLLSLSSQFVVWLDKDKSGAKGMNMLRVKMDNRAHLKYVDPWKSNIEGKDPKDCYETQGPEKVLEVIAGAKTFFEHVMEDSYNG